MENALSSQSETKGFSSSGKVNAVDKCVLAKQLPGIGSQSSNEALFSLEKDAVLNAYSSPQDSDFVTARHTSLGRVNLNSPPIVVNDLMKSVGIGRGKHKPKPQSPVNNNNNNNEADTSECITLCNKLSIDTDLSSRSNSIPIHEQVPNAAAASVECSKPVASHDVPSSHPQMKEDFYSENAGSSAESHKGILGDGHISSNRIPIRSDMYVQEEIAPRNTSMPPIDQFRDYDYSKKVHNGMESFHRGFKNRPFRPNRYPNNNSLSYRTYDNRAYSRFQPPSAMQSNMKGLRNVKTHEAHYRHHDDRRNQQSPRPPFSVGMDKMTYSKQKSNNFYADRNFAVVEVNRNYVPQNYAVQNDVNSHIPPASYVPQSNVSALKTKSLCNTTRVGNCEKSFGNKNDNLSFSKVSASVNAFVESNTSTVSCHDKSVVTSTKALTSGNHYGICASHLEKNKDISRIDLVCDMKKTDHMCKTGKMCVCEGDDDRQQNSSTCSLYNSNNCSGYSSSEKPMLGCVLPGYKRESPSIPSRERYSYQRDNSHHVRLHDENDALNKANYPSLTGSPNPPCEKLDSSLPKCGVPPGALCKMPLDNEGGQALQYVGNSNYPTLATIPAPHASYAEIMRMQVPVSGKPPVPQPPPQSQVFNFAESAGHDALPDQEKKMAEDAESSGASSDWVIARLSQSDVNVMGTLYANYAPHSVMSNSQEGVNPRLIAVSLEKPSFHNSTIVTSKPIFINSSNISSPERRLLESQCNGECNTIITKKPDDKLHYSTEFSAFSAAQQQLPTSPNFGYSRTDLTLSDTSSVCSSVSSNFKTEGGGQVYSAKQNISPVIIMDNCTPLGNVSEISFGIDMEEIAILLDEPVAESCRYSSTREADTSSERSQDISQASTFVGSDVFEPCAPGNYICQNIVNVRGKKLVWKDVEVDTTRCNLSHIVEFLRESWLAVQKNDPGGGISSKAKYYGSE